MTHRGIDLRRLAHEIVEQLPPDLLEELAKLERSGQLITVLEQAFEESRFAREASQFVAEVVGAELRPAIFAMGRLAGCAMERPYCATVTRGILSDVTRAEFAQPKITLEPVASFG